MKEEMKMNKIQKIETFVREDGILYVHVWRNQYIEVKTFDLKK